MRKESVKSVYSRINSYGNVEKIPAGWSKFKGVMSSKKKEVASKNRIGIVQVRVGWIEKRGGYKPDLVWYVSNLERLESLCGKKRVLSVEEKERREERKRLRNLCSEVGLECDVAGMKLVEGLRDVREADKDWLRDAYNAISYSQRKVGSVMYGVQASDSYFYENLCLAIGAYRRHIYTSYEQDLRDGMEYEEAREKVRSEVNQ